MVEPSPLRSGKVGSFVVGPLIFMEERETSADSTPRNDECIKVATIQAPRHLELELEHKRNMYKIVEEKARRLLEMETELMDLNLVMGRKMLEEELQHTCILAKR